jgi:predicted ArsR family transcriptional regulator
MDEDDDDVLEASSLTELQEYAQSIYDRFKATGDKAVRKVLRKRWKEIVTNYNKRVNFDAYYEDLS